MRDRIYRKLLREGHPLRAERILLDVLNIRSASCAGADKVLDGIVAGDARFFQTAEGLWWLRTAPENAPVADFAPATALFLQRAAPPSRALCLRGALYRENTGSLWEFDFSGPADQSGIQPLGEARRQTEGHLLLAWSDRDLLLWNRLLRACRLEPWTGDFLAMNRLASRVLPRAPLRPHPEDLAATLNLALPDSDQPGKMAQFLCSCLPLMLDRIPPGHRPDPQGLHAWLDADRKEVDFARLRFGREYLRRLPAGPGVYVMRDREDSVIYVGKSRALKRRVHSYFTARALDDPKASRILERLYSLEALPTVSELEALLLETKLIREFRPPINLQAEIHERPGAYGKQRNLILLVAQPGTVKATAYFLCRGAFAGRRSLALGKPPAARLLQRIKSLYFSPRRRGSRRREPWEMEILSRWLAANRNRLNFIDVDDAGSYASTVKDLTAYLNDPDRLEKKIYYRSR